MKKKPLIELDLTLPSGREVHAVCYSIQPAEPDVGIMGSYIDDYGIWEGDNEVQNELSEVDLDFVIDKFFEELEDRENPEAPEEDE
jgi:hypothetical protein